MDNNINNEEMFPDINTAKELLTASYKELQDTSEEVNISGSIKLTPDDEGYYHVPINLELPSFIKDGDAEMISKWNSLFLTNGDKTPIDIKPNPGLILKVGEPVINSGVPFVSGIITNIEIHKPPFIDYDCVQQTLPSMSFIEQNSPYLGNIGRGFTVPYITVDDVAFSGVDFTFIRERINLIKTRKTKHGKRKLIPYKKSRILFKNARPVSIESHTDDTENYSVDVKFEYSKII